MVKEYLTKEARVYNGVKTVSLINGVGKIGQIHAKKVRLHHQLTPYKRINPKWIKDLNVSHKAMKLLEGNIGSKISDSSHSMLLSIHLLEQGKQSKK